MSRNIGLVAALALVPVVGVVILPICAIAVGMTAACCGDRCGFKNLLADGAFLMLSAFCGFGSCRVNDPLAGAVSRFVIFVVATRTFVPVVCRIVFPIRTICMTESSTHRCEGICCADCTAGAALEIYCVACAVSRGFKCFRFYSFLIIGVRMWSVLVGSLCGYVAGRHYEGGGCAVCIINNNTVNNPFIKHLSGRSCTCGQSNSCTHCCLGDRSACTNGCSTACHGYIVLNSFPNCGYGSVSSNGNLVASSLFNTANAPSLELLAIGSSKAVCRERVFTGNTGYICHCACTAVSIEGNGISNNRDVLPNCSYGSICVYGDSITCSLFNTANAPSLELLTGRSSKTVCREHVFTGNTGYISHAACTAVSIEGNGISNNRDVLPNCGYGSVSSNGNLVANCLFTAANAPSLELLTGRSSKAVCRERIFAGNAGDICHCACTAVRVKAHSVGRGRGTLWLIGSNAGILIHIGVVCIGSKARGGRKKRRAINLAFPFDRHLADLRQGQSAHRINAIAVSLIACLVYIDLNRAIGVDGHTRIAINAVAGV